MTSSDLDAWIWAGRCRPPLALIVDHRGAVCGRQRTAKRGTNTLSLLESMRFPSAVLIT